MEILKLNPQTVTATQHSDHQKEEQHGNPIAESRFACYNADEKEER